MALENSWPAGHFMRLWDRFSGLAFGCLRSFGGRWHKDASKLPLQLLDPVAAETGLVPRHNLEQPQGFSKLYWLPMAPRDHSCSWGVRGQRDTHCLRCAPKPGTRGGLKMLSWLCASPRRDLRRNKLMRTSIISLKHQQAASSCHRILQRSTLYYSQASSTEGARPASWTLDSFPICMNPLRIPWGK